MRADFKEKNQNAIQREHGGRGELSRGRSCEDHLVRQSWGGPWRQSASF